jgi:hypothetical protein
MGKSQCLAQISCLCSSARVGFLLLLAIGGVVLFLLLRPQPISLIPVQPELATVTFNSVDTNHDYENLAFD